jgi:hypothetical protein
MAASIDRNVNYGGNGQHAFMGYQRHDEGPVTIATKRCGIMLGVTYPSSRK